jgi:bZIP transcription factor
MGGFTRGHLLARREHVYRTSCDHLCKDGTQRGIASPFGVVSNHPNTIQRRKAQNREAQRAYRSRKDEQMKVLKQKLADMSKQLKAVTEAYNLARVENTLLSFVVQELQLNLAKKN